ncbi:MAG TPA: isoprenylcysteine carboxylmethyltransferase family protein [Ramlibacter sp.]|uniref:methyltransferase family protein n=1 Tax=Ramlibacter sp. TaxID=1917967 RepID=UPI002ED40372
MRSLELRIPPVAVVAVAAALMWLLARAFPHPTLLFTAPWALAGALVGLGAAITVSGVLAFRRAHTTVNPMTPGASSSVVSNGIYKLTRNPMYLGFLFALAGWGLMLGNALCVLPLAGYVLYMNRFQIAPEEKALAQKFGAEYTAYTQQVRRWI